MTGAKSPDLLLARFLHLTVVAAPHLLAIESDDIFRLPQIEFDQAQVFGHLLLTDELRRRSSFACPVRRVEFDIRLEQTVALNAVDRGARAIGDYRFFDDVFWFRVFLSARLVCPGKQQRERE